jgi:hypothetical protein
VGAEVGIINICDEYGNRILPTKTRTILKVVSLISFL